MEIWGLTEAQLFDEAKKNTPILLPYQFCPMRKLLREICPYAVDEGEEEEESLYVLSNKLRSFGAASMLYEGILEKVGQKLGENYYILPSSIHEVIVVPESKSPVKQDLEEMVREINETQVEEEEVLSDRVYYFSRKENRLFL